MAFATRKMFICYCVAEATAAGYSFYKRGKVQLSDHDLGSLYSVEKHVAAAGKEPAFITLGEKEIVVEYDEPSAEQIAEISLPILEQGLQKLRADFVVAETRLLADIASVRQLTYKGPLEGDFVAAADSARDVTPKDIDADEAEITVIDTRDDDDKFNVPF